MKIFKVIDYKSADYSKMIDLRYRVLRKPLGLVFSDEYLENEKADVFCVCEESDSIIGCCILTVLDNNIVQFRQMAIAPELQKIGVGSQVLQFAEKIAKDKGFNKVILHARKVAVEFYRKHDYAIVGDEFAEVGIPHYEMEKQIK